MKKNILALNIGEETLIEGFGVVRCIVNKTTQTINCNRCCFGKGKTYGCKAIEIGITPYCVSDDRERKNLDLDLNNKEDVIYTRIAAIVKPKNN